jgi:hypothetical protein
LECENEHAKIEVVVVTMASPATTRYLMESQMKQFRGYQKECGIRFSASDNKQLCGPGVESMIGDEETTDLECENEHVKIEFL